MNTIETRFLPIDICKDTLCIKEPYLDEVIIYLNKSEIKFEIVEARVVIPNLNTDNTTLNNIVNIVKTQRNLKMQDAIKRNYL